MEKKNDGKNQYSVTKVAKAFCWDEKFVLHELSSLTLGMYKIMKNPLMFSFNFSFSSRPVVTIFHMEPPCIAGTKEFSNDFGLLKEIVAMHCVKMYCKNLIQNLETRILESLDLRLTKFVQMMILGGSLTF